MDLTKNKGDEKLEINRFNLRLELVRLTYSHGRESAEAVGRAKALEEYILEEQKDEAKPKSEKAKKGKPDNLESLL